MTRPAKVDASALDAWLKAHSGWETDGQGAIARAFTFPDFASAMAFAVKVGMAAEKRDHHPDLFVGWGKARVRWTTHDAGGTTSLDFELAEKTDLAYEA